MPVCQEILDGEKIVLIQISGRFDYKIAQQFRESYCELSNDGIAYYVDLSNAEYMDSSALGMLLLLREHARCHRGAVYLERPSSQIDAVLKMANFEKLFSINYTSQQLRGMSA